MRGGHVLKSVESVIFLRCNPLSSIFLFLLPIIFCSLIIFLVEGKGPKMSSKSLDPQRLSMQVPENYFEGRPEQLLEGSPIDATILVRLEIRRTHNPLVRFLHYLLSTKHKYFIQDEESTLRRFVYSFQNRGQLFSIYDLYIDGKRCMAVEMAEILTSETGYKVTI